jgi:hypothetical protein
MAGAYPAGWVHNLMDHRISAAEMRAPKLSRRRGFSPRRGAENTGDFERILLQQQKIYIGGRNRIFVCART